MSDTSTLLDQLAADYRRRVLLSLVESESVEIPEGLRTRTRAQHQRSRGWGSPGPSDREQAFEDSGRFEAELYHVHLPKLASEDLIEWEPGDQVVYRGARFEDVEPVVRLLAANAHVFPDDLF